MKKIGEWLAEETVDGIILSGGYLETTSAVIHKAEELLNRPINHACSVYDKRCYGSRNGGIRFYYYINCTGNNYDSDKLHKFIDDDKHAPYYGRIKRNSVGFKIRSFFSYMIPVIDDDIPALLFGALFFMIFGLMPFILTNFNTVGLIWFILCTLYTIIFQLMNTIGLNSTLFDIPNVYSAPVKNGTVYVINNEQLTNGDFRKLRDNVKNKVIKRIIKIWNRKDSNAKINVITKETKTNNVFIIVNSHEINKDIPYAASEFIDTYAYNDNNIENTIKNDYNKKTDDNIELNHELAKYSDKISYMLKLRDEIQALELELFTSNSISNKISDEINVLVELKNTNKTAYDNFIKQAEYIKNKLILLKNYSSDIGESMSDLGNLIELKREQARILRGEDYVKKTQN